MTGYCEEPPMLSKNTGPIEGTQAEQCDIEESCFMKSNLKFAIISAMCNKVSKFDIPHAANLYAPVEKAWGSSYLYYLLSGPRMLLANIANHGKAKSLERGFLIICRLNLIFIQPCHFPCRYPSHQP
jgi:hypothetical protein